MEEVDSHSSFTLSNCTMLDTETCVHHMTLVPLPVHQTQCSDMRVLVMCCDGLLSVSLMLLDITAHDLRSPVTMVTPQCTKVPLGWNEIHVLITHLYQTRGGTLVIFILVLLDEL